MCDDMGFGLFFYLREERELLVGVILAEVVEGRFSFVRVRFIVGFYVVGDNLLSF